MWRRRLSRVLHSVGSLLSLLFSPSTSPRAHREQGRLSTLPDGCDWGRAPSPNRISPLFHRLIPPLKMGGVPGGFSEPGCCQQCRRRQVRLNFHERGLGASSRVIMPTQ
ncbi:hypothetical protein C8R43DRAFT_1047450 [Mycena crocata]|nr:hypothetical protein C8R43DRAFT_1047450 [Mycena crocata]